MQVLFSIKPEYAERILNGTKRYEFRKSVPRNKQVSKIVIYATKPIGKVVGEITIAGVIEDEPAALWRITRKYSGINKLLYMKYFRGRKKGYAISIGNPVRYAEQLDLLHVSGSAIAPQSFRYISGSHERLLVAAEGEVFKAGAFA